MAETKTLQQREKELTLLLTTAAGQAELHELLTRYHAASGRLKPARTSIITYLLVHELRKVLSKVDQAVFQGTWDCLFGSAAHPPVRKGMVAIPAITERLSRLVSWRTSPKGQESQAKEEPPLRAELYSVKQLEKHAAELAAFHELAKGHAPDKLIARLRENEAILVHSYDLVTAAVKRKPPGRSGCGMASRQLLSHRRADPHSPAALAAIV